MTSLHSKIKRFSKPLEDTFINARTKNQRFRQREIFREVVLQILQIKFSPRKKGDVAKFRKESRALLEQAFQKSQALAERLS